MTAIRRVCRYIVVIAGLLLINCNNPADDVNNGRFTFCVADAGPGLAQFGVAGGRAVAWDVGPPDRYAAWRHAYDNLGRPRIESIIISHSDGDHCGGLKNLDSAIDWNGVLHVSPLEDTAKIRAAASGYWRDRINFRFCAAGDTLKIFSAAEIVCLWPPADIGHEPGLPLDSLQRGRYSLVFSVRHGHSRALVTSDIDSVAMMSIAARGGHGLRAQILAAPRHGSAGSVNALFFSYVSAQTAVISCAGYPSKEMVDELTHQGVRLRYTYMDNSVTFVSNGYYW